MKATIKIEKEVEIKKLKVSVNVRYWEDAEINGVNDTDGALTPFRSGDRWEPIIDIDEGIIIDWPANTKAMIHFKVCDDGSYYLLDEEDNTVLSIEDYYVPSIMCPKENGYGDYIIMDINENGLIANWVVNIDHFMEPEDD